MAEVPITGFHYDTGKAEALALAIAEVLKAVPPGSMTAMDLLAGLALAQAEVIRGSKLRTKPQVVLGPLADYIVATLRRRMP